MQLHRLILLTAGSAVAVLTSCGDDGAGPIEGAQEYVLESIDGARLPVYRLTPPAPGVDNHRTLYRSGSLYIGDSTVAVLDKSMEWPRDTWRDMLIQEWGSVEQRTSGRFELLI